MKKIALNAMGLKNNTGGVESYIYNNLKALLENDSENRYYLFIGENIKGIFADFKGYKNLEIVVYPVNTNNSAFRIFWESTVLAFDFLRYRIDYAWHFANYMPWVCPVKSAVTVHDLVAFFYHEKFPEYKTSQKFYNYFKKALKHTLKNAAKIIVISEFTQKELLKNFNADPSKIKVIYQSLDTRKKKYAPDDITILDNYGISPPYLLSVSVIRPHKNMGFLIKTFNRLKEKYKIPHQLVIGGGVHFGGEDFISELKKSPYKEEIKHLDFVNNQELASIYNFADVFVFPSLYEGFGIPILEAMEYNIPVVASKTASIPEVGKEACVYFDPYDIDNACNRVYSLISDEELRQTNIKKQKERLNDFNWDNTAKILIKEVL